MSRLDPRVGRWLLWLTPFAVLALAIGWQTDWGRALRREPPVEIPVAPAPVTTTVLPDSRLEGGVAALATTAERPRFNATRRPAPVAVAGPGPTRATTAATTPRRRRPTGASRRVATSLRALAASARLPQPPKRARYFLQVPHGQARLRVLGGLWLE